MGGEGLQVELKYPKVDAGEIVLLPLDWFSAMLMQLIQSREDWYCAFMSCLAEWTGLGSETQNICGNNIKEMDEECDGTDDAACPGLCMEDCTCG